MKCLSKLMLAATVLVTTAALANAAPPLRTILPTPPIRPIRPVVVVPSPVVITPAPVYFRPAYSYTPVVPVRTVYSVYYRSSPFDPWVCYNSTTNLVLAESERDSLILDYGFDAIVR